MTGVGDLDLRVAIESNSEWYVEGDGNSVQGLEVDGSDAPFDPADHQPTDVRLLGEILLGPSTALAHLLDVAADPRLAFR
ncbi:MAG TPA: hypothetical protein VIF63_08970 [Candidatus Limnocylindrales bacterium]|jgi:hypothetical protein